MSELPKGLERGERARLFPVLAETSKEGRTASVFLACMANVHEYGRALLLSLGQRVGSRARIESYTEIGFSTKRDESKLRPDGLIVLKVGSKEWRALVEAKVGSNELTAEQVDAYIDLAQANGVDAVITISNQFGATPQHHPVNVKNRRSSKVQLFHWSWMYLLTEADLLLSNNQIVDDDQRYILDELNRFLLHPSAGVKGFDKMPLAWNELTQKINAGGAITPNSTEVEEVVGAWHQEIRDLTLILSRQVGVQVTTKLARHHMADRIVRLKDDMAKLAESKCLAATLIVPGAVGPIEVVVDMIRRTVGATVRMKAPEDRQSTKARVNWLLRQLHNAPPENLHIRLHWPGRGAHTQHSLSELHDDITLAEEDRPGIQVSSLEVCMVRHLAGRFTQSKNFIVDLEKAIPDFYESVVQHLKAWQAPAPRMREDRTEAADVAPDALAEDAEDAAIRDT